MGKISCTLTYSARSALMSASKTMDRQLQHG
jgi:hypothetical protein